MSLTIQLRRGTAAQWAAANPVLADGESGFESDTRQVKIGDGVTQWNALTYFFGKIQEGHVLGWKFIPGGVQFLDVTFSSGGGAAPGASTVLLFGNSIIGPTNATWAELAPVGGLIIAINRNTRVTNTFRVTVPAQDIYPGIVRVDVTPLIYAEMAWEDAAEYAFEFYNAPGIKAEILAGVDPAYDTFLELRAAMLADESTATTLATLVASKANSADPVFSGHMNLQSASIDAHLKPTVSSGVMWSLGGAGEEWKELYVRDFIQMTRAGGGSYQFNVVDDGVAALFNNATGAGFAVAGQRVVGARQAAVPDVTNSYSVAIGSDLIDAAQLTALIAEIKTTINGHGAVLRSHGLMAT